MCASTWQAPLNYLRFDDFVHAVTELSVLRIAEENQNLVLEENVAVTALWTRPPSVCGGSSA